MTDPIVSNLKQILMRIKNACRQAGREPNEVRLLMATKTVSPERIKIALNAGQRLIGENKVQEVKEKFEALQNTPHESHFIGHLQTNKVKDILKYGVSCVQSLDRLELAEKLHSRLSSENRTMDVLIQVNTSNEESKFGVPPENAIALVKQVAQFETLKIKGLMTIGLLSADTEKVRNCFKLLKNLQQEIASLNLPNVEMRELSMGMSEDLEIAIEEGATIIRVGTAIFGKRFYPENHHLDCSGKL